MSIDKRGGVVFNGISNQPTEENNMAKQIVVADRGWVFVGDVLSDLNGDKVINEAKVVRIWGTTKGLGELAISGPTSKTVLDESGTVRVPARSVVAIFDCKW